MTAASLVACVLLGQVATVEPAELVSRLGASRYADREAAAAALETLGRSALPSLRSARDERDPEIRTRAAALLTKIEGTLLTQPTLVSLDFDEMPLTDVLASVSTQCGTRLALQGNSPSLLSRKVMLHEPSPLPFWKAIDRLCEAASLQYNRTGGSVANGREPTFPLYEGGSRPSLPTSDSGPFRVSVVTLHYQRDVNFSGIGPSGGNLAGRGPKPPGARASQVNEQFFAQLQVAGEPRLSLTQSGAVKVSEAVDDKGNRLEVPSSPAADVRRSGYFGFATGSVIQFQAALTRPANPGSAIRSLKGAVPVTVSTRKPEPLTVPLNAAEGRTFQNDHVSVTVNQVRAVADGRSLTIDLTVKAGTKGGVGEFAGSVPDGEMPVNIRPNVHQQQIELADAKGRPIPWHVAGYDLNTGRMSLSVASPDQAAPASTLRYYSLVRATTEVPFAFSDVPMP